MAPERHVRVASELDTGRANGAEAALRLLTRYNGLESAPVPAIDLRADDPWAEGGRKVLRFHLARTLARVPGAIVGADAEEVHAMRVAARRMRAAWRVFGDGFDRAATRSCREELRDLGRLLGAVRDLDVLIETLVKYQEHRGSRQRAGLELLLEAWRAEGETRHVALREMLTSNRLTQFVIDNVELTSTPGMAAIPIPPNTPGLVRNRMPVTIWAAYQKVWAYAPDPHSADLATLHQLRISAKWLRYTLEFAGELLEPDGSLLVREVVALQDQLGTQHDHVVAASLAREYLASADLTHAQKTAIATFVDRLDRSVERMRKAVGSTWRPVADPSYRRSLGRALARL